MSVKIEENKKKKSVIILGGGLAGLSAGWILQKNGYSVKLIEKCPDLGGLAITREKEGYKFDLGPHNIHSSKSHIIRFLSEKLPDFYEHCPFNQIYKNSKFIRYPLQGIHVILALPKWKIVPAILSFVFARIRLYFRYFVVEDSFEQWIKNRFGSLLFEEYFGSYAKKVWGIPSEKIDKYVAEKRVPTTSLLDMLKAVFTKKQNVDHPEFAHRNYYFKKGVHSITAFFKKDLEQYGAEIKREIELINVKTKENHITSIIYKDKTGNTHIENCDFLLSTIPLNQFIPLFENADPSVLKNTNAIDYCSTILIFLKIKKTNVFTSPLVYFSDPSVRFSRVSDVGMYSESMVPQGKCLLCVEFPCSKGDEIWNDSAENLSKYVLEYFVDCKFIEMIDFEGSFHEKIEHSYPRFKVGFKQNIEHIFDYLSQFKNVLSFGRQGGFSYLNVDGVIDQGFNASISVIMSETIGEPCMDWFAANGGKPFQL